jgi:hypothetical protein
VTATALRSLAFGALAAAAPAPKDTPQVRNILLYRGTLAPDEKPTIKEEALQYDEGGHDVPNQRERVYALLGPGATVFGVAAMIEPFVNFAPDTQTAIPTVRIAQAIVRYNAATNNRSEDFIKLPSAESKTWPDWRVGMRVPLPLEIKSKTEWIVHRETINTLDEGFTKNLKDYEDLLKMPAAPLEIPDPRTLEEAIKKKELPKPVETLAASLAKDLLVNPYEPVFRALELMRQIDKAKELTFALKVLEGFDDRQAKGLGRTTGGAVVLRRLWHTLTNAQGLGNADPATLETARKRVGNALGLKTNNKPEGFDSPTETWPSVTPLEIPDPIPKGAIKPAELAPKSRADEDPLGMQAMVLGRQLCIGNTARTKQSDRSRWSGPSYAGRIDPDKFAADPDNKKEILGESPSDAFKAAYHIVLGIVENEGWLDAVRAADAGMISTGLQQWSAHSNRELPVLLARFKTIAPHHYDAFFGLYGLDARPWAPAEMKLEVGKKNTGPYANDTPDATPDLAKKIRDANPDWVDAQGAPVKTPYGERFPTYCSFWNLDATPRPAGTLFPPPGRMALTRFPPKPKDDPRATFFGARYPLKNKDGKPNEDFVEVSREWAARFRLVSLCSIPYCVNQFQLACYRIRRIIEELPGAFIELDGNQYGLKELANSQFSAAAVLDAHINAPWDYPNWRSQIVKDLNDAITRTPGTPHDPGPPKKLRDEWLLRFRVNYLGDRFVYGKKHRDGTIIGKHDATNGLSASSKTFETWV